MNGLRRYLIFGGILILLYLIAQYFKPKPLDWTPTYLSEDKIPYGTYILHSRIQDIFPGATVAKSQDPIYNTLHGKKLTSSNYFIVASSIKITKIDYIEMIKYMQNGNNIFIAAADADQNFLNKLKLKIGADFELQGNNKSTVNFTNPKLSQISQYHFDNGTAQQYFSKIDTAKATVLGTGSNNRPNFVQYKFGKGSLFIMPNPQLLTNYTLLKADGLDYASKALSYLPKAGNLIWDESFTRPNLQDTSPLRMIFNHESLKMAYYISMLGLVLFVLFEIKRRQRIIPLIDPLRNTSVEFVNVIGRLYYQQRNNRDIAEKKIGYLLEYVRNKYRLRTLDLNDEFKEALVKISGAQEQTVEQLLAEIHQLKRGQMVSDQHLISLNKIIEKFYKEDQ